jgi:hypothetical protein
MVGQWWSGADKIQSEDLSFKGMRWLTNLFNNINVIQ